MSEEFVVSAPAKVLVAGGFLVLERPHTGTVLALDARFYAAVRLRRLRAGTVAPMGTLLVEVLSPQFRERRRYLFSTGGGARLEALPVGEAPPLPPNRYVETPLLYTLALLHATRGDGFIDFGGGRVGALEVVLAADNSFYSQGAQLAARGRPRTAASLRALPPLLPPTAGADGELAKTGLGSSATLVTSLVAALLHAFGAIELLAADGSKSSRTPPAPPSATVSRTGSSSSLSESSEPPLVARPRSVSRTASSASLGVLHALAQLSHCAAQGKVGSGFDVSCAVFGSQQYTRFAPAVLREPLECAAGEAPPVAMLLRCVHSDGWDQRVTPVRLPPGVELMMGDVACGAHTPSMIRKVQAWRAADAAAAAVWAEYAEASAALQAALGALVDAYEASAAKGGGDGAWLAEMSACGSVDAAAWAELPGEAAAALAAVRAACVRVRALLRDISTRADVPIEPPAQSALLDATMEQRGVLIALVPGAGGFDAIIALVLPQKTKRGLLTTHWRQMQLTRSRVGALWQSWPPAAEGGGAAGGGTVSELPVVESSGAVGCGNGVRLEGARAAALLREACASLPPPPTDILGETEVPERPNWRAKAPIAVAVAAAVVISTVARVRK